MLAASQSAHPLDALALAATALAIAAAMLGIVTIGVKYYGKRRDRRAAVEKSRQRYRDIGTSRRKTPHND